MPADPNSLIVLILVGLVAGWLAGLVVQGGGFGIVGMRERVKASGGTLAIEIPGEWGGWSVRARLPMSAMDALRRSAGSMATVTRALMRS